MILADKIMTLRKKTGWSQEELAAQLNVSRQSVSKWEGAQSIPDMDKVVQMSRLFGVTTDFLLKDELEMEEHTQSTPIDEPPLRRVTMEEASAYLALRREAAPKMALATCLCILSPVALLMLAAMSEFARFGISENAAAGIGLCVLLVLVAIGVALFLTCAAKVRDFDFLEKVPSSPSKPPPISPKDFQLVGRLHERSSFHSSAVRKREKQAREPEQKMFRLPSFVYETRLGSYCPSVPYSLFIYRERGKQGFDEHESLWKGWGWRKVFPSLFPNLRPIFLQTSIPACRRPLRARPQ